MITIDINIAIALFFSFCLILVFGLWLFYNLNEDRNKDMTHNIVQCPYCSHLFNETRSELIRCPQCKSIIDITTTISNEEKNVS